MTAGQKAIEAVEKEEIMTYADMFSKVKGMLMDADVSDIHEHLAYQFQYYGRGGRNFLRRGKGRTVVCGSRMNILTAMPCFTCSAETLFKIADGKTDPILAVTLGKLKVEGNIDKALKLKDLINSKKKTKSKIRHSRKAGEEKWVNY